MRGIDNRIKDSFDQIHTDEALKARTRAAFAEKAQERQKRRTLRAHLHSQSACYSCYPAADIGFTSCQPQKSISASTLRLRSPSTGLTKFFPWKATMRAGRRLQLRLAALPGLQRGCFRNPKQR